MTTPTHATLGFAIGAALGHPFIGIAIAVCVDIDHLTTYVRHGVLRNPRLFWNTITDNEDSWGSQRGWLHSLLIAIPVGGIIAAIQNPLASVLVLSYASHLLLDLLDSADYWPFYPFKFLNIRGPVRFFSKQEVVLAAFFLTVGLCFM